MQRQRNMVEGVQQAIKGMQALISVEGLEREVKVGRQNRGGGLGKIVSTSYINHRLPCFLLFLSSIPFLYAIPAFTLSVQQALSPIGRQKTGVLEGTTKGVYKPYIQCMCPSSPAELRYELID